MNNEPQEILDYARSESRMGLLWSRLIVSGIFGFAAGALTGRAAFELVIGFMIRPNYSQAVATSVDDVFHLSSWFSFINGCAGGLIAVSVLLTKSNRNGFVQLMRLLWMCSFYIAIVMLLAWQMRPPPPMFYALIPQGISISGSINIRDVPVLWPPTVACLTMASLGSALTFRSRS